jgi:CheY-like chemotaxis protein
VQDRVPRHRAPIRSATTICPSCETVCPAYPQERESIGPSSGATFALANPTMSVKMVQVVVIDDDEDDFKIVKDLLYRGAFGVYEPLWVNSYAKGLQMLKEARGDVFLLDYQLGEKSGLDLLREAGGRAVGKPVIMLTGTEDPEVDLAAMEAGAAYFVSKSSLVSDHLLERTIRLKRRKIFPSF